MPILLEDDSGVILMEDGVDVILLESEISRPTMPPGNEFGFFFGMSGMMHRYGADD